jgi:hypothetical protein
MTGCVNEHERGGCGTKLPARCVTYGNDGLPEWSELDRTGSAKDALDELYRHTDEVNRMLDLTDVSSTCFPVNRERLADLLQTVFQEICIIENGINELKKIEIAYCEQ